MKQTIKISGLVIAKGYKGVGDQYVIEIGFLGSSITLVFKKRAIMEIAEAISNILREDD